MLIAESRWPHDWKTSFRGLGRVPAGEEGDEHLARPLASSVTSEWESLPFCAYDGIVHAEM